MKLGFFGKESEMASLESVPRDVQGLIILLLDLSSVLSLSEVSKRLNRTCKRMVGSLLDEFYPEAHHTLTPWAQLIALNNGVCSYYINGSRSRGRKLERDDPIKVEGYRPIRFKTSNEDLSRKERAIAYDDGPMLVVPGLPVPSGQKMWASSRRKGDGWDELPTQCFKTHAAAFDHFFRGHCHHLMREFLNENALTKEDLMRDRLWTRALNGKKLYLFPVTFDASAVYHHVDSVGLFHCMDGSSDFELDLCDRFDDYD